jgi:hypothetical protein
VRIGAEVKILAPLDHDVPAGTGRPGETVGRLASASVIERAVRLEESEIASIQGYPHRSSSPYLLRDLPFTAPMSVAYG